MEKESFEKYAILLLGIAILVFSVSQLMQQKPNIQVYPSQTQEEMNTIQVTGEATITTDPDKAEIFLGAQTDAVTAKDAQEMNAAVLATIRSKLFAAGIQVDDIQTSQFSVSPRYSYFEGNQTLIGYTTVHILKISTKNLDRVGNYIDAAVDGGANRVDSVSFTLSTEKELSVRNQALKQASQNAIDKANSLASGFGVTKGKITKISESYVNVIPYQRYLASAAVGGTNVPTEISPAQVQVQASVSAVFELK
jgi:hypothetical protein